jgi:DNA-binding phage protein
MGVTIEKLLRECVDHYLIAGGTLNSLSDASGVDPASLHRWWHSNTNIRLATAQSIADAAGLRFSAKRSKKGRGP